MIDLELSDGTIIKRRGTLSPDCEAGTCGKNCPCYTDHEVWEIWPDKPCTCVDCVDSDATPAADARPVGHDPALPGDT